MTTLISSSYGGVDVTLVRYPDHYTVAVTDSEGLLHLTAFDFDLDDVLQDEACEQALDWFDHVEACVSQYVRHPDSQSIQSLVSTLN